jgi:hypothetical protein
MIFERFFMKCYKKIIALLSMLFITQTAFNIDTGNLQSLNLNAIKKGIFGPSLVPANDPRVIGVIVASIISIVCGSILTYKAFADEKENEQKSFLKRALAFIVGNILVSGGFAEIFFARASVTALDEITHQVLQEINNNR